MVHFATCCKIELATAKDQIALALLRLKHFLLSLSRYKRNLETASERPDRYFGFLDVPAKNALVVSDGAVFPERGRLHHGEGFLFLSFFKALLIALLSLRRV